MYSNLIASLILLRSSYAWTTTISFQIYLELLQENPIGITPDGPFMQQLDPRPLRISMYTDYPHAPIVYQWQIYPSPTIAPNNRPLSYTTNSSPGSATWESQPEPLQWSSHPLYISVGSCTNVPPGTCCRTITPYVTNGQFSNLPPGAISAFWGPGADPASMNGCEERILDSHYGAPQWGWRNPAFPPRVSGASYISCPATIARGWGAALAGFCARLKKRDSGPVAVPTPTWVWPDLITVAGVNHTDGRRGNLLYYDSEARLINLTHLL